MPNHVRNKLTIVGPARDIATFVLRSQTPRPRSGDRPSSINFTAPDEQPTTVPFHFHGVVPLPARYSTVPYDPQGYDMEVATWGTKWGPYFLRPARDIQITEHRATYTFATASVPPDNYYLTASAQFPQCTLYVSWGGEGPCAGRAVYQAGVCLDVEEMDDDAFPEEPEDDDNEEAMEAYYRAERAAQEHYLTLHDAWVDATIQKEVL
jgi:hypothetical protein